MNLADLTNAEERKVIAVDFDKTLTTGEGPDFWEDDEQEYPNEDVVSWVNDMYHDGHVVLVWTARPWTQAATVESYLVKWGVEYHGLRCNKTGADLYVDDKARNVEEVEAHGLVLAADSEPGAAANLEPVMYCDKCEETKQTDECDDCDEEPECDDTDFFDGTVEFYNKNGRYGFIDAPCIEEDVFFHMADLNAPEPEEGYEVTFKYETADQGPRVTDFYNVDPQT